MQKEKRILEKCKKRLLDKAKRKEVLLPQEQWLYDNIPMLLEGLQALPQKYKPLKKEAARLLPISPLTEETLAQKLRKQKLNLTEDDVFMLPSVLKALYFNQAVMCASSPEKAKTDDIKEAITGFRAADRLNMKVLHPMISPVAALFSKDALFAASSHETRLCYIRAVKALSTASGLTEITIAKKALSYAENDLSALLLGEKKNDFRLFLGLKKEKRISPSLYVWLLLGTVYAASFLFYLWTDSVTLVALARFLLIGLFSAIFSRLLLFRKPARPLPRLSLDNGIPPEGKTVIVTPVFMGDSQDAKPLIDKLAEAACLSPENNLVFALLVDFKESRDKETEADQALLSALKDGMASLQETFGDRFVCLVRHREPCADGLFRPKERKRGALLALVRLLTKNDTATFRYISSPTLLQDVRYVITLDRDTVLPLGAAKKLIGTMMHPLNRPVVQNGIVRRGYGVIQPRIAVDFDEGHRTFFSAVYSGGGGLDPYSAAASDFYQEIFEEGIYTGKGIFDPKVFEDVLSGAIPENRVLSHDLLEGSFVRCGLCSDIFLLDGYPSSYLSFSTRQHRWIRGDWQLLPWLLHQVRMLSGRGKNPLTVLSRWKIFDNLRRSVTEPVILLLILGSFFAKDAIVWLLVGLTAIFLPVLLRLYALLGSLRQLRYRYMTFDPGGIGGAFLHSLFSLAFLPHAAKSAVDAILRTLYRLLISKKNLLQWVTAADADRDQKSLWGVFRTMWICPALGVFVLVFGEKLPIFAVSIGMLWLFAPWLAYQSAQPPKKEAPPTPEEAQTLLSYAAATWRYFDEQVTEDTHWLPPDNFQESPPVGTAFRTSPTNMGLYLLSLLFAARVGFISAQDFYDRLDRALCSLFSMERQMGHFYNWYDLKDLSPLAPRFISTVDSGNLLACLMTVQEGLNDDFPPRLSGFRAILGLSQESFVPDETGSFEENLAAAEATPLCAYTRRCIKNYRKKTDVTKKDLQDKLSLLIAPMDFAPLYDAREELFTVGIDCTTQKPSDSRYDLLASEARLGMYIAVAKGDVPPEAWFSLSRPLCHDGGRLGLASWSGTAFEYLMPRLFLPEPKDSLLGNAAAFCLFANEAYQKKHRLPFWGISESSFFAFDRGMSYRYTALGVPALALSRKRTEALCTAPYAAGLSLPFAPKKALSNLKKAKMLGMLGKYGFYEAYDKSGGIVRSFMAHHQGMFFAALCNRLTADYSVQLFSRMPQMNSCRYLCGENLPSFPHPIEKEAVLPPITRTTTAQRVPPYALDASVVPEDCAVLSNGTYSILLTASMDGYAKKNNLYLTRFRRTPMAQGIGIFLAEGDAAFRLTGGKVTKHEGFVLYEMEKNNLYIRETVTVPSDKNEEYRKISIENLSDHARTLRLSVYIEPSLQTEAQDLAHPAFGDLFLRLCAMHGALYAERRPLRREETAPQCRLFLSGNPTYCTDGLAFWGQRENEIPVGAYGEIPPSENPAEPCMAGVVSLTLAPHATTDVYLSFGMAEHFAPPSLSEVLFSKALEDAARWEALRNQLLQIPLEGQMLYRDILPFLVFSGYGNAPMKTTDGMDGLFRFGISGDRPYLLFVLHTEADLPMLKAALFAYRLWQSDELCAELVILCDDAADYTSPLYEAASSLLSSLVPEAPRNHPLGIYLIPGAESSLASRASLKLCAAYILGESTVPVRKPKEAPIPKIQLSAPMPKNLHLDNGYGGFSGHDYVIYRTPPIPWSHPLANESFGTWESTNGTIYSWFQNSRLCQITPWRNLRGDKTPSEFFTLNGKRPVGGVFRFGLGYCMQTGEAEGYHMEKTVFVPPNVCGKFVLLSLKNKNNTPQDIDVKWHLTVILGESEVRALGKIRYVHGEYVSRLDGTSVYVPRTEAHVHLAPEEEATLCFYMGKDPMPQDHPQKLLEDTKKAMETLCTCFQIETPNPKLDTLFNERLMYQTVVCRLWARSSPYQCGGAFGYRDQLQDILSLLYTHADMAKAHILKCASFVYEEGDVPHWWHEVPQDAPKGIRTTCADDGLWLIYAVSRYIEVTKDFSLLSEEVGYLKSPPLASSEKERYETLMPSPVKDSVYQHLLKMADQYITHGAHQLPLMRGGDWNDGFGKMGEKGKGESVWMAFFLSDILKKLAHLCRQKDDAEKASFYETTAADYLQSADTSAWDGAWYLRAFHDDGSKIGSHDSSECKIDGLVQAWAAMVHPTEKANIAMHHAWQYLWNESQSAYALFTPAFTKRTPDPGYVAAYHPGVRENGGQYTHAALWAAIGFAALSDKEKPCKLLCGLNPLHLTENPEKVERYKAEPYAVCADVYTTGRGGWSWYTGSAGWYREAIISSLLGFQKEGDTVTFRPCLPSDWTYCRLDYRYYDTWYRFHIRADGKRPVVHLKNSGGTVDIEI